MFRLCSWLKIDLGKKSIISDRIGVYGWSNLKLMKLSKAKTVCYDNFKKRIIYYVSR